MQNHRGVLFRGEKPCTEKLDDVYKMLCLCEEYLNKNEYLTGDHLTLAGWKVY